MSTISDTVVDLAPGDASSPALDATRRESLAARVWRALAAPLLLAVLVQNIANFGFHAVVGRVLPAGDYGALGSVLAIMVLLSVPLMALQAAASAAVADGWDSRSVRRSLIRVTASALLAGALLLPLTPTTQSFYRLAHPADAAVLAPFVAVSIVLAASRGFLLGDRQVRTTGWTYLGGTVVRFGFGVALVLRFGVTGALVGTLLGELAALVIALVAVARRAHGRALSSGLRAKSLLLSAGAVTGLFLFSTVDLLLARHFLPDNASGSYTAAATIGKTVLALPAAAIGAYFPQLVTAWGKRDLAVLRRAVVVVSGLALAGAAAIAAAPHLLLHLLFGEGFADTAALVRLLASIAGVTSIVSVLTYAALARRGWSVIVPWLGALIEVGLIVRSHESAEAVARASFTALLVTVVAMTVWELPTWWRAARTADRTS